MKRRALVAAVAAAALAAPLGLRGQTRRKPYRIGFPFKLWPVVRLRFVANFREHGWQEGRDYTFVDSGLDPEQPIETQVESILAGNPDLLVVTSTAHAVAAHRRSQSLPIVMIASGYPVEAGVAQSLARPGKNVTGNSSYAGTGVWGKLLELLKESHPSARRIGVLWDYVPPVFPVEEIAPLEAELARAEAQLGIKASRVDVSRTEQLSAALAQLDALKPGGLLLTAGPVLYAASGAGERSARQKALQFAVQRRLPTISDTPSPREEKGLQPLLVYSPSRDELRRQAFAYVVRILGEGTKPGELPIQRPSKFELVANLRMAKAIGLTLPRAILIRADRVIE